MKSLQHIKLHTYILLFSTSNIIILNIKTSLIRGGKQQDSKNITKLTKRPEELHKLSNLARLTHAWHEHNMGTRRRSTRER